MDNENNTNGVNNSTVVTKVVNKEKSTNEREKNTYRNLETSMLVSATYDGKKNTVILKFYNPVCFWMVFQMNSGCFYLVVLQ